jgi:hypothetical protein
LTFFPTWASNRNLIFQTKLQNSLCSYTSWGYMCNTNEMCDTYPENSWYRLLKNVRKSWNNHKLYCTLWDNFGQKYSKTDTVQRVIFGSYFGPGAIHKRRRNNLWEKGVSKMAQTIPMSFYRQPPELLNTYVPGQ